MSIFSATIRLHIASMWYLSQDGRMCGKYMFLCQKRPLNIIKFKRLTMVYAHYFLLFCQQSNFISH